MGDTISAPYLACAAIMSACRWVASKIGASGGDSARRFDSSFATWFGLRSAWSKEGCWQRARIAFSKSTRMTAAACAASSLRVGAATMEDARISLSNGRRPILSANLTKSKFRKTSPSPRSIPSRNLSARKGSRARRCVSWTRRRNVRAEDGSNAAGEAVDVSLLWECTMRRRMKWRYVSMPCCSDSYTRNTPNWIAMSEMQG